MKTTISFLTFLSIFFVHQIYAQCTVTATANPVAVCQGEDVNITTAIQISGAYYYFDFNNNSLPPGWAFTGAATFGTTPACAAPSLDNTSFYWSSTASSTPILTTTDLDVSAGGSINYDFKFAPNSGTGPCETADQYNEGVALEYSTNGGGTWNVIVYHCSVPSGGPWAFVGGYAQTLTSIPASTTPGNGNGSCGIYDAWANYVIPIPPAAQTVSTRFRWRQPNSSGSCCDNWGLDNVNIAALPNLNYDWSTGASGSNLNTLQGLNLQADTCFVVTVTDTVANFTCLDTVCVLVTAAPDMNLTISNPYCVGDPVTLDASASSATLTNFQWDLNNDGTFEVNNSNPIHTTTTAFTTGNIYTIHLQGSTPGGCAGSIDTTINMYNNPQVNVTAVDPTVCTNTIAELETIATITNASGQNSVITNYDWDFENDGTIDATGANALTQNHNFPTAGTYPVTVTVTTDIGCTTTQTLNVIVNPIPQGTIYAPNTCSNEAQQFSFLVNGGGPITTYNWDFGDPSTTSDVSNINTPLYNYTNFGTYTVNLIAVNNNGCTDTFDIQVNMSEIPAGYIQNVESCEHDMELFNFIQTNSSNITNYQWSFPNGNISSSNDVHPVVSFSPEDTVTIQVILENEFGCIDTITGPYVINNKPIADFTVEKLCISRFEFQPNIDPNEVNYSLHWNMGDETQLNTSDTSTFNHLYNEPGTFNSTLIIQTNSGCNDTLSIPVVVDEEMIMKIPNVLVPSSLVGNDMIDLDALNPGLNYCVEYDFIIFNRWGNMVHELHNDPNNPDATCSNCFSGKNKNGNPLSPGVYFYTLKGNYNLNKSGSITIVE